MINQLEQINKEQMTRKQIINHSFFGNSVTLLQSPFSSTLGSTLMACNQNDPNSTEDPSLSIKDEDILTLEGYTTIFANCEDTSILSSRYEALHHRKPVRELLAQLKSADHQTPISRLLNLPTKLFPNQDLKADGHYNLAQIYSLLENVYRNALLRSYIPAYRTINTHCGRYRSYIEPHEYPLLERLNFEHPSSNLYTYKESDELYTIKYAIISGILMNRYCKHHKASLNSSSSSC